MKKLLLMAAAGTIAFQAPAQVKPHPAPASGLLDTIFVTHGEMVHVIMPGEIAVHAFGTPDMEWKKSGRVLFIRAAKPGVKPTSLLVQYGSNQIFKGIVVYRKKLTRPFYDYSQVATPTPASEVSIDSTAIAAQVAAEQQLARLQQLPPNAAHAQRVKGNRIRLTMTHLMNDQKATYLAFRISNESSMPYTVDYVSFAYRNGIRQKKQISLVEQTEEITPVAMMSPERVEPGQSKLFLYALPIYSPNDRSHLLVNIRESGGNRTLQVSIPAKDILTAKILSHGPEKTPEKSADAGRRANASAAAK